MVAVCATRCEVECTGAVKLQVRRRPWRLGNHDHLRSSTRQENRTSHSCPSSPSHTSTHKCQSHVFCSCIASSAPPAGCILAESGNLRMPLVGDPTASFSNRSSRRHLDDLEPLHMTRHPTPYICFSTALLIWYQSALRSANSYTSSARNIP